MRWTRPWLAAGLLLPSLAAAAPHLPVPHAERVLPLSDGGWLVQQRRAVLLLGVDGSERATLALRGEGLDLREGPDGVVAVVIDAGRQAVRPLRIDLAGGHIVPLATLPAPDYKPELACLYRDPQGLVHVFVAGKAGQGEQWLLGNGAAPARKVRDLPLPPQLRACTVDDAGGWLYVAESELGVWAYGAAAEAKPVRQVVQLRQPWGLLRSGVAALAAWPGGLALVEAESGTLRWLEQRPDGWRGTPEPVVNHRYTALAAGAGKLVLRDAAGHWSSREWPRPSAKAVERPLPHVLPQVQTDPVASRGDAADDPAIWVHPTDPAASRVLATNKKQGLLVYDLDGRERQLLPVGRLNNVDLRQQVRIGGRRHDLAVATHRDEQALVLFSIGADGQVSESGRIPTDLQDIYGLCTHQPPDGGLEVFANGKDGSFRHYRIVPQGEGFGGELVRRFALRSQPEGCVVDDARGQLFLGEERRGVWVLPTSAAAMAQPQLIAPVGPRLRADVEGLALYHGPRRSYLVVSSQGDHSYAVFDAAAPYRYRGSFRIGINAEAGIDGASETDGLDVTSAALGPGWEAGMLVVQDGYKRMPDGPQNFKYVRWADVARVLGLE